VVITIESLKGEDVSQLATAGLKLGELVKQKKTME
jgi:hypothetical protein